MRLTYYVFDLLAVEGFATTSMTYAVRRELLEQLEVERTAVR